MLLKDSEEKCQAFRLGFPRVFFLLLNRTLLKKIQFYFAPLNKYMQEKYVDQPRWQSAGAC